MKRPSTERVWNVCDVHDKKLYEKSLLCNIRLGKMINITTGVIDNAGGISVCIALPC